MEMDMNRREFETLLLTLESTPALLEHAAAGLSPACARRRPAAGGFSFVENVWHLADLEREGFGVRIRRILSEDNPALPDFDGDRVARERDYQLRTVEAGLFAFADARRANLEALRAVSSAEWKRRGMQDRVGTVTLADVPRRMAEHDRSHTTEVAALLEEIARPESDARTVRCAPAIGRVSAFA
jgi:hypothetical protein